MSGTSSDHDTNGKGRPKRKRPRGTKVTLEEDESAPDSKRASPIVVESDNDSIGSRHDLVIAESEQDDHNHDSKSPSPDSIDDLPMEALIASTLTQFSSCIRPSLMIAYPAATSAEINAITNTKWKSLKEARRKQAGNLSKRTKTANLPQVEEQSRPKRRAVKNISRGSYLEVDYTESPMSNDEEEGSDYMGVADETEGNKRIGEARVSSRITKGKRYPKIKVKMIRGTEENSATFLAQPMDDFEDCKENRKPTLERDSETSSIHLEDANSEPTDEYSSSSQSDENDEENEDQEENDMIDSEGEHTDYCCACKDVGQLLCCDRCPLAYHLECAFPPLKKIPEGEWLCQKCIAEELPGKIEKLLTWRWLAVPTNEDEDNDAIIDQQPVVPSTKPKRQVPKMREFFVKWLGKSYWKCSWVSQIRIDVYQPLTLRYYCQRHNMDVQPLLELPPHQQRRRRRRSSFYDEKMEEVELTLLKVGGRPEWLQVQRIINSKSSKSGNRYLVKWRDLAYDKATWETLNETPSLKGAEQAIKQFEKLKDTSSVSKRKKGRSKAAKTDPKKKYTEQPEYITATGGTLHPYQLEGINWLRFSWAQGTNTILADEMGLGKTIQTIAFLYSLVKEGHSNGPFLISAPLSTIINWEREFEFWAPDLYVVTYTGAKENRAAIREHEFSFTDGAARSTSGRLFKIKKDIPLKFNVLLTSYEFVTADSTLLQSIDWSVLVVDEAHRLKNNQSKFFKGLSLYNLKSKLLLTGTPLQNNLEELFHLLNFLSPESFSSLEDFQEEFADISKEDQIKKLHEMLGPHLLRRLKADVMKNMPSKSELIVRVDLAPTQKKYYKWILTKNFEKLNVKGSHSLSLLNVMMDLKKCCNHPYLFPSAAEEAPIAVGGYYEGKALVASCGKLIVVEKMLRKLREQGHRVLIFSQMTRMLDILEDFLEYLGYKYERIDGNIAGSERQLSIDRFNAPNSEQSVFLLSTRAGGLGINLATADTVIIYDSDWNPHNDIQAFSRAHRIGQANKVMIYRLVTRNSVEERVCEVAKRKMMLTHLVVRSGFGTANQPSLSKRELDDILKFGTEELFKDDESSDLGIVYDDKAIENLLDRSLVTTDDKGPVDENLLANQYLGQFKVASYVMKEEVEPETEIIKVEEEATQPSDPDFWEKLLRHHYEQQNELEAAKLGKGKRIRKQVNYHDGMAADLSELRGDHEEGDESAYSDSDNAVSEEETDDDEVEFPEPGSRKKLKRSIRSDIPPLLTKVNDTIHVYGFNPRQRRTFLNQVLRFGMPPPDVHSSSWMPKELRSKSEAAFSAYVASFMKHLCEPDTPNSEIYSDGVPKNAVSRQNILTRIGVLKLILNKINQYKDINGEYSLPEDVPPSIVSDLVEHSLTAVVTVDKADDVAAMETENKTTLIDDKLVDEPMEVDVPPALEIDDIVPKTEIEVVNLQEKTTKTDISETDSEPVIVSVTKSSKHKPKLKFNIADGGFTELHTMWAQEKTDGFDPKKWGRHHDYWLLKGITLHGFCRWTEICSDPRLSVLNKPFLPEETTDTKNRFLLRRYKLLEQALAVEEQLHRASNAGLHQSPNDNVMQLHSRFTDLDCLADGHQMLIKDCTSGNKNAIMLMRKALGKMEELLLDMKSDVSKLSMELTKIPPVSNQLKIDELSILGKLAGKDSTKKVKPILPSTTATVTISQPSVITQGKAVTADINKMQLSKPNSISVSANDQNIMSLSNNNNKTTISSALQLIQQKPQTATVSPATLNMAQYAVTDGTTLLMPTQAVGSQQLLYWAPRQVPQGTIVARQTPGTQASILTQPSSQTTLVAQKQPSSSNNTQYIKTKVSTDSSGAKVIHIE